MHLMIILIESYLGDMKQQIGYYLQLLVMGFLPLLILWQLNFGFRLILMPALTVVAIVVFAIGHTLRESK